MATSLAEILTELISLAVVTYFMNLASLAVHCSKISVNDFTAMVSGFVTTGSIHRVDGRGKVGLSVHFLIRFDV